MEEDVIPSAFIFQHEIRHPRFEKLLTVLLAPSRLRILIVLPKAHVLPLALLIVVRILA